MTDDHILRADIAQHEASHFARVRAFFNFGRAVLPGDTNVRTFEPIGDGFERCENRRDNDFAMVGVCDQRLQRKRGVNCVAKRLVHLPVSGDYRFAHRFVSL